MVCCHGSQRYDLVDAINNYHSHCLRRGSHRLPGHDVRHCRRSQNLSLGMTRPQVIEALGTPTTAYADSDKREEHLIYRRMSHVVSWGPQNYQVTLRDGKVVRYGEQSSESRATQ